MSLNPAAGNGTRHQRTERSGIPAPIRIGCVSKTSRDDPWDRVRSVGGTGPGGTRWQLPESDAIAQVENGTCSFCVREGSKTVDVTVATHSGHKYLKTAADGEHPDSLLTLPECP